MKSVVLLKYLLKLLMKFGFNRIINHITKLQSGCRGQAAPPFNPLLCSQPTGLVVLYIK